MVMMIRNEDLMFENINLFEYQAETLQGLEREVARLQAEVPIKKC